MKVKCETNSFGSGIVVWGGLLPSSVSVPHDDRIDIHVSVDFCIEVIEVH